MTSEGNSERNPSTIPGREGLPTIRESSRAGSNLIAECGHFCGFADSPLYLPVSDACRWDYNVARMALTSGTKLGPYEIVSPLGAGGCTRFVAPATRGSAARSPSRFHLLVLRSKPPTVATISVLLLIALVPASSAQRDPELERQDRSFYGAIRCADHTEVGGRCFIRSILF